MRQPKYKFGDTVILNITMEAMENKDIKHKITTDGKVVGVYYDIKSGTHGWPHYHYTIHVDGSTVSRGEGVLKAKVD